VFGKELLQTNVIQILLQVLSNELESYKHGIGVTKRPFSDIAERSCKWLISYSFQEQFVVTINNLNGFELLLELISYMDEDGAEYIAHVYANSALGNATVCEKIATYEIVYTICLDLLPTANNWRKTVIMILFMFISSVKAHRTKLRKIILNSVYEISKARDSPLDTRLFASLAIAFLADENLEIEVGPELTKNIMQAIMDFINATPKTHVFNYSFLKVQPFLPLLDYPFPECFCLMAFLLEYIVDIEKTGKTKVLSLLSIEKLHKLAVKHYNHPKVNMHYNRLLSKLISKSN